MTEGSGYKRPPMATRWKKGQSGNPSGRKRGTPNLRTDLISELAEVIQVNEQGAPRRITKQRALLKSLAARAIAGDGRAANLILNLILRLLEPDIRPENLGDMSAEDEAILQDYLQRAQAKKGSSDGAH